MRGQTRGSPVLVQRAVSEDPRWTRAVGDPPACPQMGKMDELCYSMHAIKGQPADVSPTEVKRALFCNVFRGN